MIAPAVVVSPDKAAVAPATPIAPANVVIPVATNDYTYYIYKVKVRIELVPWTQNTTTIKIMIMHERKNWNQLL